MWHEVRDLGPVDPDEAAPARAPTRSHRRLALAASLAAAAVVIGTVLVYPAPPKPIPSLFGMDASAAAALLRDRGYEVALRPARACEPRGLVLGTEPRIGTVAPDGSRVTVRYAVPASTFCMPAYEGRVRAWEFVRFAAGGPGPAFADEVAVRAGARSFALTADAATDPQRWRGSLDPIRDASERFAPTSSGMPRLAVGGPAGPLPAASVGFGYGLTCAPSPPTGASDRSPLRLQIQTADRSTAGECPLTVDLYRDAGGRIDAVAIASASRGDVGDTG